jgi:hypothetical protein
VAVSKQCTPQFWTEVNIWGIKQKLESKLYFRTLEGPLLPENTDKTINSTPFCRYFRAFEGPLLPENTDKTIDSTPFCRYFRVLEGPLLPKNTDKTIDSTPFCR